MSNKKSRKVIVLGAGASIGAKKYPIEASHRQVFQRMPSMRNFFHDIFQAEETWYRSKGFINILGLMYEGTNGLIAQSWGMSKNLEHFEPEEWKDVNVEEVLTFLETGARMHQRNSSYQKAFSIARSALIDFIGFNLAYRCDGQHCELLRDVVLNLKPSDTVISFNYDTIADVTLERYSKAHYQRYAELMSGRLPRLQEYRENGVLLKFHGSVNWYACTYRQCNLKGIPRILYRKRDRRLPKLESSCGRVRCPNCGGKNLEMVIVPPKTEKLLNRNGFLHKL